MAFVDLTHQFKKDMPVFPGDKPPGIREVANIDNHGYNAFRLDTGMHIGTHMDAPLHMIQEGKKLNDYPVDTFAGKAVVIDMTAKSLATTEMLASVDLSKCEILLFRSGWSQYFGEEKYYFEYPEISKELAISLTQSKIRMVGLDWPSPDRAPYEVHRILLGNDILIIENLKSLNLLPANKVFQLYAFPYTYDIEGSPVRVIAEI